MRFSIVLSEAIMKYSDEVSHLLKISETNIPFNHYLLKDELHCFIIKPKLKPAK